MELIFKPTIGVDQKEQRWPADPSLIFNDVVIEYCKKLGYTTETNVSFSPPGGLSLSISEMMMTVQQIVTKYGNRFEVFAETEVGR